MKKETVINYVDPDYVISLTQQLVRLPTESPGINPRSKDRTSVIKFIKEQFEPLGLETKLLTVVEEMPNIVVEIEGNGEGPTIMLFSHVDTIEVTDAHTRRWTFDPFGGDIKDGKLYGVGASDDKSSAAGVIGAVKAIVESGIKFRGKIIVLLCTTGESGVPGGCITLIKQHLLPKADGAILADNSDQKLIRAFKGRMWVEIVVHGKSVHASTPEIGINAINKSIDVVQTLQKIKFADHEDPELGKVTLTPTSIEAISVPSSVPGRCSFVLDMRLIPGLRGEQALRRIQDVLDDLMEHDTELDVVMNGFPDSIKEACEIPLGHPIVQATAQAMDHIMGHAVYTPGVMSGGGFWFSEAGVPGVQFGPGSILNAHMPNEYVEVSRLGEASQVYALATLNLLGVSE